MTSPTSAAPTQPTGKPAAGPGPGMWDKRYSDGFVSYGTEPNAFLRAVAGRLPAGPVLVIGAGEGRNAVFLAGLGHDVTAVDQSAVGLAHATDLATKRGVQLTTEVADLVNYDLGTNKWAAIVAIWTHLPPPLRRSVHAAAVRALRPGGAVILEAYAPAHLDRPGVGGPPSLPMLMDPEMLREEFAGLAFELCQQVERDVAEGRFHTGPSTTTQVLAFRVDA